MDIRQIINLKDPIYKPLLMMMSQSNLEDMLNDFASIEIEWEKVYDEQQKKNLSVVFFFFVLGGCNVMSPGSNFNKNYLKNIMEVKNGKANSSKNCSSNESEKSDSSE